MKKLLLISLLCITAYFSNAQLVLRINKYLVDSAVGGISYLWFDTSYNPTGQGHWKNIGSGSGGGGSIILAGQNYLSLAGGTLTANAVNLSGTNVTGTLAAARFPALTGAISNSAGSLTTTLNSSSVTAITDPLYIKASGTSVLTGNVNIATNTRSFKLNDTTSGNNTYWQFLNGEIEYTGTDGATTITYTASPTNGFYEEGRDAEGNFGFGEKNATYSNLEYRSKHGTITGLLNYYERFNNVSPYSLLATTTGDYSMGVWMDSLSVRMGFGDAPNDNDLKGFQVSKTWMHIQPPVGKLTIDSLNRITSITGYQFLVRHAGNDTVKAISLSDLSLQGALTLTTTGSSGAATLIGNTLNIPQYSGGGGGGTWGSITGTLSAQTDLQTALTAKEDVFTELEEEFTSSTSSLVTISNSPITNKAILVYFNGVLMKDSNIGRVGTAITISGITRETSDVITVKYSFR